MLKCMDIWKCIEMWECIDIIEIIDNCDWTLNLCKLIGEHFGLSVWVDLLIMSMAKDDSNEKKLSDKRIYLLFIHLILGLQLIDIIVVICHLSFLHNILRKPMYIVATQWIMKIHWQGKQHSAQLDSNCFFRFVELSWAQFDYMLRGEICKVSNQLEILTVDATYAPISRPTKLLKKTWLNVSSEILQMVVPLK